MEISHTPVMAEEVISFLKLEPGSIVVDGTVGEGGHSVLIAEQIVPDGFLIGIDKDRGNIDIAETRISLTGVSFKLFCSSYSQMEKILMELQIEKVDRIFLDLGFSMRHIRAGNRGFSFLKDEVLDMRYDNSSNIPAHEWLNKASKDEITTVLWEYGEEADSRRISSGIVSERKKRKILSSMQLADIVLRSKKKSSGKVHPATKTFQAIRIFINNELDDLKKGLESSVKVLKKGSRLAVLTYHSIEDRIVKEFLEKYSGRCLCPPRFPECRCGSRNRIPRVKVLKAMRPAEDEVVRNPSARSAHLRGMEVEKAVNV